VVVTVNLSAVPSGTKIDVEQAGVPGVIPADACYIDGQ
jgi:hypothetical protein